MNFKLWLESIFDQKQKVQASNISKLLGFSKPLKKFSEGTFATLYQHPTNNNLLIKVTSHKDDIINLVKSQNLNSPNVAQVFDWKTGKKIKEIPELKSYAIIVEKIVGFPIEYLTADFYDLTLGNFEFAQDWLKSGGHKIQQKILEKYNKNNEIEHDKLAQLFGTLFLLQRNYNIDLSDFQDNILDDGEKYIIIDMGY